MNSATILCFYDTTIMQSATSATVSLTGVTWQPTAGPAARGRWSLVDDEARALVCQCSRCRLGAKPGEQLVAAMGMAGIATIGRFMHALLPLGP